MRARVMQNNNYGMWYGQIYDEEKKKWETVTSPCFTRIGAKIEIQSWKRRKGVDEFEV